MIDGWMDGNSLDNKKCQPFNWGLLNNSKKHTSYRNIPLLDSLNSSVLSSFITILSSLSQNP